jgi:glycosyltransferase involved in cell wall biosynthesis
MAQRRNLSAGGSAQFVVITPCYRQQATLRDTVESVVAQHYQRWRMLIIDDGTPDEACLTQAHGLQQLDDRILPPVHHTYQWGLSATRNHGAALTRNLGDQLVRRVRSGLAPHASASASACACASVDEQWLLIHENDMFW